MEILVDADDGTKEIRRRKNALPHYELVSKKLHGISVTSGGLQAVTLPRELVTGSERHFELQRKAMMTMFAKKYNLPVTETLITDLGDLNAMLNVDCMIVSEKEIDPRSGVEFKQRPRLPPNTEKDNLTLFMSKIHTDNNFCNEQTGEKSSKLFGL